MDEYLNAAIKAAKEAGRIALSRSYDLKVSKKNSKGEIVTNADLEAEQAIIARLSCEFPEIGFVGEEKGVLPSKSDFLWIVDPIDGTRNYSLGIPFYCTSIALVKNNEPLIGVVYDPTKDELFYAIKGKHSYLNSEWIHVSKKESLDKAVASMGCILAKKVQEIAKGKLFTTYRYFGAIALELCYVACGRIDFMLHNDINPWDGAAGALVVRESGGVVVNHIGKQWQLNDRFLLASNLKLQKEFTAKLPQEQLM
ncbi:MAG: inositol monophosphatase [Candidatus Diapherotrites archaeon]|nr:inositol monophosphatase [Candidatus Diapherotrites archaeon]